VLLLRARILVQHVADFVVGNNVAAAEREEARMVVKAEEAAHQ